MSQIEKGQRALKGPKVAAWAAALGVGANDLHELWQLCQGLVPADGGRAAFYDEEPGVLGTVGLDDDEVTETLGRHPELEPIYQLAVRICTVMRRLLPSAEFAVQPRKPDDLIPADLNDESQSGGLSRTLVPLPVLWVFWHHPDAGDPVAAVTIPLLEQPTPVVRRRAPSVSADHLQRLIRSLSGAERERVRGYIEAIIEDRSSAQRQTSLEAAD